MILCTLYSTQNYKILKYFYCLLIQHWSDKMIVLMRRINIMSLIPITVTYPLNLTLPNS